MTLLDVVVASALSVLVVLLWHLLTAAREIIPGVNEPPNGVPWQPHPSMAPRGICVGCLLSLLFWGLIYAIVRLLT